MHTLGDPKLPQLILIGGVHGDEPEGSFFVEDFLAETEKKNLDSGFRICVRVIPAYNPDGLAENSRTNANGVDLNRNFPAQDWSPEYKADRYFPGKNASSEPETKALVELLRTYKPFLVVHCHTYIPQINYTGEISRTWAEKIARDFEHPVTDNIGYPTPGSLGQYCFYNLKTACVCIELPEQVERKKAWRMVGPTLIDIAESNLA